MRDNMFKIGSINDELMKSMEQNLIINQKKSKQNFDKLVKTLDYLNTAANIFDNAGFSKEASDLTYIIKKISEDSDWEDKLEGGLADNKSPDDFDQKALAKGVKVEMEHTNNHNIAKEIAMDHLTEDSKYYDKLELIESH
jgi:hypothetical protein